MKPSPGIAVIAAACLLLWVYWLLAPDHQQPESAIETVESEEVEKLLPEQVEQEVPSFDATTLSIADRPPVIERSDGTWGELVEFRFERTGCDTETIGINSQIPCSSTIVADHHYELFSDDQLRQIANTDGIAALILGTRLGYRRSSADELRESINLLHAAVALTGHVDALNMLMTQLNVTCTTQYVNGKLDTSHASKSYVLHKTGNSLGLVPDKVVDELARLLRDDGSINIAALNAAAAEWTEWFRERRQIMTGQSFTS